MGNCFSQQGPPGEAVADAAAPPNAATAVKYEVSKGPGGVETDGEQASGPVAAADVGPRTIASPAVSPVDAGSAGAIKPSAAHAEGPVHMPVVDQASAMPHITVMPPDSVRPAAETDPASSSQAMSVSSPTLKNFNSAPKERRTQEGPSVVRTGPSYLSSTDNTRLDNGSGKGLLKPGNQSLMDTGPLNTWSPRNNLQSGEDMWLAAMLALAAKEDPQDPEIESALKLVQQVFLVPAAAVSLFQDCRVYVKEGSEGVKRGDFSWRQTLCTCCGMMDPTVTIIQDTSKDNRFKGCPGVLTPDHDPNDPANQGLMRSFIAMSLISSNGKHHLGSICLGDTKPRTVEMSQSMLLNNMSKMIVRNVEKDIELQLKQQDNKALNSAYAQLTGTMDCLNNCMVLLDITVPGFKVTYANSAWKKVLGLETIHAVGNVVSNLMETLSGTPIPGEKEVQLAKQNQEFRVEARLQPKYTSSTARKFILKFRPTAASGDHARDNQDADLSLLPRYYFMTIIRGYGKSGSGQGTLLESTQSDLVGVEGLELGQLLGRGAFGSVYKGCWFGTPVAVKVIDQDVKSLAPGSGNMEALLGTELRHPHIACTLTYVIRYPPGFNSMGTGASGPLCTPASRHGRSSQDHQSGMLSSFNLQSTSQGKDGNLVQACEETFPAATNADACTLEMRAIEQAASTMEGAYAWGDHHSREEEGDGKWAVMDLAEVDEGACEGVDCDWPVQSSELSSKMSLSFPSAGGTSREHMTSSKVTSKREVGSRREQSGHARSSRFPHDEPVQTAQIIIVMELCDKGCLQDAIDNGSFHERGSKRVNMRAVLYTAHEIAGALYYLHTAASIVHGDLSAYNVLLAKATPSVETGDRGFNVKIADFGLARILDIQSRIQTRNYGTITHMPPETLRDGTVSKEMDVYSYGVLVWQMFTGKRPWQGLQQSQIIMRVISQESKLQLPEDAPEELANLVHKCLSYKAEDRPPFQDIMRHLKDMIEELL